MIKNKMRAYVMAAISTVTLMLASIGCLIGNFVYKISCEKKAIQEISQTESYKQYYNERLSDFDRDLAEGKITKRQYNQYNKEIFEGYILQLPSSERAKFEAISKNDASNALGYVNLGLALDGSASILASALI